MTCPEKNPTKPWRWKLETRVVWADDSRECHNRHLPFGGRPEEDYEKIRLYFFSTKSCMNTSSTLLPLYCLLIRCDFCTRYIFLSSGMILAKIRLATIKCLHLSREAQLYLSVNWLLYEHNYQVISTLFQHATGAACVCLTGLFSCRPTTNWN